MRIFQLAPSFGSAGGTETYAAWLSEVLLSRGHQTAIAASAVRVPPTGNYDVIQMPELAWREADDRDAGRRRILEVLREFRPDCVLVHGVGDGRLLRLLQRDYSTVEFVHSFICRGQKLFRRADQTCKHPVGWRCLVDWYAGPCGSHPSPSVAVASLRQARDFLRALATIDLVVVGSRFMKGYLVNEGLDGERIEIVDMSMDLAPADPAARLNANGRHVVFVGRTVRTKGIQYLLRAMSLLDPEYRLTIVGEGWYWEALRHLTGQLGLERRVTFAGALQGAALRMVCDTATVAVVPSIYPEPAGLVVPEMRSLGIPVVVTDVGGLSEWASRDSGVRVAEPADAASLAAAIRHAVENRPTPLPTATLGPHPQLPAVLEALYAERVGERRLARAEEPTSALKG
jgi:glycosyltransferase involved in cell wall biosynthesis